MHLKTRTYSRYACTCAPVLHVQLKLSRAHKMRTPCICIHQTSCRKGLQWARSMGVAMMANKKTVFVMLMDCAEQFKECWSQFFVISTDMLILMFTSSSDTYMCTCQDMAIFVVTTDRPITSPLVHVHGVIHVHVHHCFLNHFALMQQILYFYSCIAWYTYIEKLGY